MKNTQVVIEISADGNVRISIPICSPTLGTDKVDITPAPTIVAPDTGNTDKMDRGGDFDHKNKTWKKSPTPANFDNWWGKAKEVSLSKDDPDFAKKKAAIKAAGFKWNPERQSWVKP